MFGTLHQISLLFFFWNVNISSTGEPDVALGYATLDSETGEGKLLVSFPFAG